MANKWKQLLVWLRNITQSGQTLGGKRQNTNLVDFDYEAYKSFNC